MKTAVRMVPGTRKFDHIIPVLQDPHWLPRIESRSKFREERNGDGEDINPLRAKFFRVNINMYLHSMSFLRTNKTQVVEIPPRVRQGPAYTT